jgi:hypothetical protein
MTVLAATPNAATIEPRSTEKSSLRDEAKMDPPQVSEKRREFDPTEVTFKCNIKSLIRGGAKGIRTACLSLMRSRTLGIFPSSMSTHDA